MQCHDPNATTSPAQAGGGETSHAAAAAAKTPEWTNLRALIVRLLADNAQAKVRRAARWGVIPKVDFGD
jgi:hypothetical protein